MLELFKKLRLTVFFAAFPALLYVLWSANQTFPFEVELTVELLEGPTFASPQARWEGKKTVAQLYCKGGESTAAGRSFYTGELQETFSYNETTQIAENTYLFSTVLPCGSDIDKLRFDPVWDQGTIVIKRLRFHTFRWFDLDLETQFSESMRILNSIEEFAMTDEGILVESAGHDPFIQISDSMQDYLKPDFWFLLRSFLLAAIAGTLAMRAGMVLWIFLVDRINTFEEKRADLAVKLDRSLERFSINALSVSARKPVNWVPGILILGISTYANILFLNSIYPKLSFSYFLAFMSAESQFLFYVCCFLALATPLIHRGHRSAALIWGLALIGAGAYLADALLYLLNGMHIGHGIQMLFVGGIKNFYRNLAFTKLSNRELISYQVGLIAFFIGSFLISRIGASVARKNRFALAGVHYLVAALFFLLLIISEQFLGIHFKSERFVAREQKDLPLYLEFRPAKDYALVLQVNVTPFSRKDLGAVAMALEATAEAPRQIYLVILESIRDDVINAEFTPNLFAFREQAITFAKGIANGNATHYAWYSIVNSRFPLFWETHRDLADNLGSAPLLMMKGAGYTINVHTAKDLRYLHSLSIMFGKPETLFDFISDHPDIPPPTQDQRITDELITMSLEQAPAEKSMNLVFWDSTHYPYRWPEGMANERHPFAGEPLGGLPLNEARRLALNDRARIFNRYLNSVRFTDDLFGQFIGAMTQEGLFEDSVIVVVGDHGQQFMEHGFMMHGRTLFNEDLRVPLFMHIPGRSHERLDIVASEIDIMATLLDLCGLGPEIPLASDGKSLLTTDPALDFAVAAVGGLQNTPYLFALETTEWKIIFELEARAPKESRLLFVKEILDRDDREFIPGEGREEDYRRFIQEHFAEAFQHIGFLKVLSGLN